MLSLRTGKEISVSPEGRARLILELEQLLQEPEYENTRRRTVPVIYMDVWREWSCLHSMP